MKKSDITFILALLALTAVVILVVNMLLVDSGRTDEPAHIRLKNRLHRARYNDSDATELAVRLYRTNNRADAAPLPLMQGSCGWQVELVQRLMNRFAHSHLVEDGYWGPMTERAIHRYYTNQSRYGVPVWNRFFSYVGISYRVSAQQFADMTNTLQTDLM